MSDNNRNSNNIISIRLNHANYNAWKTMVETYLNQKVLFHHIEYSSFIVYRAAVYEYSSNKEKKYFTAKEAILSKPFQIDQTLPDVYTLVNQGDSLDQLETDFKEDFKYFESDIRKALEKWQN